MHKASIHIMHDCFLLELNNSLYIYIYMCIDAFITSQWRDAICFIIFSIAVMALFSHLKYIYAATSITVFLVSAILCMVIPAVVVILIVAIFVKRKFGMCLLHYFCKHLTPYYSQSYMYFYIQYPLFLCVFTY